MSSAIETLQDMRSQEALQTLLETKHHALNNQKAKHIMGGVAAVLAVVAATVCLFIFVLIPKAKNDEINKLVPPYNPADDDSDPN
jgi:hypothetical protein